MNGWKWIAASFALCGWTAAAFSQTRYTVTDMGVFAVETIGQVGMVIGRNGQGGLAWEAEHGATPIPGLQGIRPVFWPRDVNANGQVVGHDFVIESNGGAYNRAFVWDRSGGTREVGHFGYYSNGFQISSQAYGINDLGQVVGQWDKS